MSETKKELSIEEQEKLNKQLFHWLLINADVKVLELIKQGADVNATNNLGHTALDLACNSHNTAIVKVLLDNNAKIDDDVLYSPCFSGNTEIVKLLLEKKASPNAFNEFNDFGFNAACSAGNIEIVKLLLKNNVKTDVVNSCGQTALHIACQKGYTEIVKLLLDNNVKTGVADKTGQTVLHIACQKGYTEIVNLVLDSKVSIDNVDKYYNTPLGLAIDHKHWDIVKLLLAHCVIIDQKIKNILTKKLKINVEKNREIMSFRDKLKPFRDAMSMMDFSSFKDMQDKLIKVFQEVAKNNYSLMLINERSGLNLPTEMLMNIIQQSFWVELSKLCPKADSELDWNMLLSFFSQFQYDMALEDISELVDKINNKENGYYHSSIDFFYKKFKELSNATPKITIDETSDVSLENNDNPSNSSNNSNKKILTSLPATTNNAEDMDIKSESKETKAIENAPLGKSAAAVMANSVDKTLKSSKNSIGDHSISSNSNNNVDDNGSFTWQNNNSSYNPL